MKIKITLEKKGKDSPIVTTVLYILYMIHTYGIVSSDVVFDTMVLRTSEDHKYNLPNRIMHRTPVWVP